MSTATIFLRQRWRIAVFAINIAIFYIAYFVSTGNWYVTGGGEALWLLSALGLWGLALISAPWYRPPRDAISTAIAVLLALFTLDLTTVSDLRGTVGAFRNMLITYSLIVLILSIIAATLEKDGQYEFWRGISFRLAHRMASGEFMFGATALISIFGFYSNLTTIALLTALWAGFAWLKPIEIIFQTILQIWSSKAGHALDSLVGTVQRVDHPNIVRVTLSGTIPWKENYAYMACLPGGRVTYVLPLFTQIQGNELVATGICIGEVPPETTMIEKGEVYLCDDPDLPSTLVAQLTGSDEQAEMVGFVVEGSTIASIKFEVSHDRGLEEGMVVFCNLTAGRVFYQILEAQTAEESFHQNPRGTHIVHAAQLGTLDPLDGFKKFPWLPPMNAPVFRTIEDLISRVDLRPGEFKVGTIPSTNIGLKAYLPHLVEYHTAILGVTGTGKTELALDIIREALNQHTKVFCVDLTGEYRKRLGDCTPTTMGLTRKETGELDSLLFDVDAGGYKATAEKKALKDFIDKIKSRVISHVAAFLESGSEKLGLFELAEVTNTRATLRATELFLSEIMIWARSNRKRRRILIVLEEAHTIIPETAGSGFDYDTQWIVGRIGQIALQGRKYGVGLMIVSQRTALVSKTILSQCNTYFTHSLIDQTSLGYLSNIYGQDHVRAIPNLRFLEFIAYGKGIRSERPMLARRPFDEEKRKAGQDLDEANPEAEAMPHHQAIPATDIPPADAVRLTTEVSPRADEGSPDD